MSTHLIYIIAATSIDIDATIGIQMVLFLVFLLILHPLILKPYLRAVDLRREGVQGSKEDAAEFEERAEAAIETYEKKMQQARRDASDVRDTLRSEAQKERDDILSEARAEISEKLDEEREKISAQVDEARQKIEERSENFAAMMVDKILPEA